MSDDRSGGGAGEGISQFVCCATRIDSCSLETATEALLWRSHRSSGAAVHLCNAYTLSLASGDPEYRGILNSSFLNLPDGMPLVWISRLFGLAKNKRPVRGAELMLNTLSEGQDRETIHYLYGSTAEVLSKLEQTLLLRLPRLRIAGAQSPPFRELTLNEEDALVESLLAVAPDIVWVGLGTPKQDLLAARLANRVPAMFVGVGAAFDFLAGSKPEAPALLRRFGLEWLYRFAHEPRRLWRRYLLGNVIFLRHALSPRPKSVETTRPN